MPTSREPLVIGPFAGGLNTYDDPTAVRDTELVEALNWDPGLEGSLRSRPPFTDTLPPLPLGATGNAKFLGFYSSVGGATYLIASDGLNSTWAFNGLTWALITSTISATAVTQFDNKAWLLSPVGDADPGGYWTPAGGFVADSDMPHGDTIVGFKSRLWVSPGKGNPNGTRIYYSKVLGQPSFWATPSFVDVGQGDGQEIVLLEVYYSSLVAFRTQSIYNFSFTSDPAQGAVTLLVPNVGLSSKDCLISYENYLYFMFDEKAYQFVNNNATQINLKVPFTADNRANISTSYAVSLFNNRAIFHFFDTMYVYSLRTKTWTRWKSQTHGAIGQIMSPDGILTDQAYVLPSGVVPPPALLQTNVDTNPRGVGTTGHSASVGSGSATFTATSTGGMNVGGLGIDTFTRAEATTVGTHIDVRNTTANGILVGAGLILKASAYLRLSTLSSAMVTVYIQQYDSGGVLLGTATSAPVLAMAGWNEYDFQTPRLPGAYRAVAIHRAVASVAVGSRLDATAFYLGEPGNYVDGTLPDTGDKDYAWTGTVNASPSTLTSKRATKLLYITDAVTNASEDFQCVVQTKNYNYQNSANFKRLFWWGVDAVFRTKLTAFAIPVVQRSTVTWGQLRTRGITWGQLLSGTWGFPLEVSADVVTNYDLSGFGPSRKFAKMRKGLRFRQIYFRVIFDTDGSLGTAPVNLFTITAYVATKETVSKGIS